MHISEKGLRLIESFEGFSSRPYNDGTGVQTIGFGTTTADVNPLPQYLTRDAAEGLLRRKLAEKYEPAVNGLRVPLNQNQFDALCSFVYNLGPAIFDGSDIGNHLRAHDYTAAANSMLEYDHAGGQVLEGLARRRQAEKALFLTAPVSVDLNHYERYDRGPIQIGGITYHERATVKEYDKYRAKHPRLYQRRLRRLRDEMSIMASRLTTLIEDTGDSKINNRGWREKMLDRRAAGQKVAV